MQVVGLLLVVFGASKAFAQSNFAGPDPVDFEISRQPTSAALLEFAEQASVQLVFKHEITDGLESAELQGEMSRVRALERLLDGTGLEYEQLASNLVVLKPKLEELVPKQETAVSEAPERPVELEEIIITATKQRSPLMTTPASVSAITQVTLDDMGAHSFKDFYRLAPGLSVQDRGPHQKKIVIRGIQNAAHGSAAGNTVGVYIDDMPVTLLPSNEAIDLNLFDMQRVEVLRGPQGTLYGASSMAGTIRYITHPPELEKSSSRVRSTFAVTESGDPSYGLEGMLNVPLAERDAAVRLVAYSLTAGGFIDKTFEGAEVPASPGKPAFGVAPREAYTLAPLTDSNANTHEVNGARASVRWEIDPRNRITFRTMMQESTVDDSFAYQAELAGDLKDASTIRLPRQDKFWLSNLQSSHELGRWSLYTTASYLDREQSLTQRFDGTLGEYLTPTGSELFHTASTQALALEARLKSPADEPVRGMLGLWYYQHDHLVHLFARIQSQPDFNPMNELQPEDSSQWAVFGELDFDLGEKTTLSPGFRFTHFAQDFGPREVLVEPMSVYLPARGLQDDRNQFDDDVSTFKLSLSHRFSDQFYGYALVSEGYRPGGFNQNILDNPQMPATYEPDSLVNYELGGKWQSEDERWRILTAIYHNAWSDMQSVFRLDGVTYKTNAGRAHITGIEVEFQARPRSDWLLSASGTVREAQLDNDVTSGLGEMTGFEGKEGDRLIGVPNVTFTASAQYEFSFGKNNWMGSARADLAYVGDSYTRFRADPPADPGLQDKMDSYTLLNLRARMHHRKWSLGLFCDNVLDTRAELDILELFNQPETTTVVRPRTIGVEFEYRH